MIRYYTDIVDNMFVMYNDININACTTDCGANILAAIKLLNFKHLSCFGHVLNTAINKLMEHERFNDIITKSKKNLNIIAHSYKMVAKLKRIQESLNRRPKKIPSASPTRWWSTLILIEAVLEEHLALIGLFAESPKFRNRDLCLTNSERIVAEALTKGLKPFQTVSDQMSNVKYITTSAIIPVLENMQEQKYDENDEFTDGIRKEIHAEIIKAFKNRYSHLGTPETNLTNLLLNICTYLDPRFKRDYFSDETYNHIICTIKKDIASTEKEPAPPISEEVKSSGLSFLIKKRKRTHSTEPSSIDAEILKYEAIHTEDISVNALDWWKANESYLKLLASLAKKYLCVPATSVPSERVFSCGGNIISDLRASLTAEHAEQLIFLSMNREYVPK